MKTLIVIDMQHDFIDGPLGTAEARAIVPKVQKRIEEYVSAGDNVIFTRDTHYERFFTRDYIKPGAVVIDVAVMQTSWNKRRNT